MDYRPTHNQKEYNSVQPKRKIISRIDKLITFMYPKSTCLTRSLVKRDVLRYYGYNETIALGLAYNDGFLVAHAWLETEVLTTSYKKVHSIS